MAGYIGSKSSVTLVDGYTEAEADAEFVTKTGDTMTGALEIQGGHGDILKVKSSGSGGSEFALRVDGNEISFKADADNDENDTVMTFDTDGSERMRIDTLGNVGIGTSSPSRNLHVSGGAGDVALGITNAATGTTASDGFSITVENPTPDVAIRQRENNDMKFLTNNTERMRIDSAGKVGIGDSSPSARLEIGGMAAGEQALLIQSGRNDALSNGLARINITDSNCPFNGLQIDHAGTGTGFTANSGGSGVPLLLHRTANSGQVALFYRSGVNVGSISVGTSSAAYNTSSDYRLKENVVDLTGASARVNQLNPSRFNFIADNTNTLVDGFLAHEVANVVPEAITGTKDAMRDEEYEVTPATGDIYTPATDEVDEVIHSADAEQPETLEDGQQWRETTAAVMGTRSVPDYQGIDQSKLVPLLTAALQEALTEIASLKTRVEALEA